MRESGNPNVGRGGFFVSLFFSVSPQKNKIERLLRGNMRGGIFRSGRGSELVGELNSIGERDVLAKRFTFIIGEAAKFRGLRA